MIAMDKWSNHRFQRTRCHTPLSRNPFGRLPSTPLPRVADTEDISPERLHLMGGPTR